MLTPRSLALREAPRFALARVDLASRAHGSRVRQPLSDVTNRRGIDPYHHSLNQRLRVNQMHSMSTVNLIYLH